MKNKELYYRDRAYQLVDEGVYEGIKYFIVSYGTHHVHILKTFGSSKISMMNV